MNNEVGIYRKIESGTNIFVFDLGQKVKLEKDIIVKLERYYGTHFVICKRYALNKKRELVKCGDMEFIVLLEKLEPYIPPIHWMNSKIENNFSIYVQPDWYYYHEMFVMGTFIPEESLSSENTFDHKEREIKRNEENFNKILKNNNNFS